MNNRPRVVVVGAGNVANHLAPALSKTFCIAQVCATSLSHAQALCEKMGQGQPVDNVSALTPNADIYLICVKDAEIANVAKTMPQVDGVVIHTSGSVASDVLSQASDHYGAMYPLQTFSRDVELNVTDIPFFTEASDDTTLGIIDTLASSISSRKVTHLDSPNRALMHLAAVFGCNFTNLLWGAADNIMRDIDCSLNELEPLIKATLAKALANNPADVQTGPASRRDTAILHKQESLLASPWNQIYASLSQAIMDKCLNQPILKQDEQSEL